MNAGAKKPRSLRPHRSRRSHAPRGPRIPTTVLTARDVCEFTYDASNARIGCIIKTANGFAAWSLKAKLGEFTTRAAAERAVLKDAEAKQAAKSRPWEVRS